jgi:hypothetical protein
MRARVPVSGMKERSKLAEIGVSKELTKILSEREANQLLNALLSLQKCYLGLKEQEIVVAA